MLRTAWGFTANRETTSGFSDQMTGESAGAGEVCATARKAGVSEAAISKAR